MPDVISWNRECNGNWKEKSGEIVRGCSEEKDISFHLKQETKNSYIPYSRISVVSFYIAINIFSTASLSHKYPCQVLHKNIVEAS